MLNSIKKFFNKVEKSIQQETPSHSSEASGDKEELLNDFSNTPLPNIWTGVDLDGTLAYYDSMSSIERVGEPIPKMMKLVKRMIANGIRVKIFTARATDPEQIPIIEKWFKKHGLPKLEITNVKDYYMQRLYDDRCIQVERNTGSLIIKDQ